MSHRIGEVEGDWRRYREVLMEVAEEVCGKTTGHRQREREKHGGGVKKLDRQ